MACLLGVASHTENVPLAINHRIQMLAGVVSPYLDMAALQIIV